MKEEDHLPSKNHHTIMKCAEWLTFCLSIGWGKDQLDALEKLWWQFHDKRGLLKETPLAPPGTDYKPTESTKEALCRKAIISLYIDVEEPVAKDVHIKVADYIDELKEHLQQRDELIKELIPYVESLVTLKKQILEYTPTDTDAQFEIEEIEFLIQKAKT